MIEPKNLKRQNFTFSEIDQNKANALVERLTTTIHHAPTMVAHDTYITSAEELMIDMVSTLDTDTETLVVIMALDNVASRRTVNEAIMDHLPQAGIPVIAIDSGNDDLGGQLKFMRTHRLSINILSTYRSACLDHVAVISRD